MGNTISVEKLRNNGYYVNKPFGETGCFVVKTKDKITMCLSMIKI